MGEESLPWGGTITGDAGPYTDDEWTDVWRKLFQVDRTLQGVLKNYENELEVTGVTSPVSVDTGAALVDGKWYENDASLNVVVPSPVTNPRYDRIVLTKDFAAQTVRVERVAGAEGGGVPALTQTDGVEWQIPLATVYIIVAGNITLTDTREWIKSGIAQVTDRGISLTFHGGSGALPTGVLGGFFLPTAMSVRITGWQVAELAGNTPTCDIDVWVESNPVANGIPTNADSITNGNEIDLAAAAVAVTNEAGIIADGWTREHDGGSLWILNLDTNNTARIITVTIDWETYGDAS
jgi:hypothetical protein